MNTNKSRQAELLFREIGEIRDEWIQESIAYTPIRHKAGVRISLIAACIAISLIAILSFTIVLSRRQSAPTPPSTGTQSTDSLDAFMVEHRADFDASKIPSVTKLASVEEYRFTSGTAHVVWQYADSEALYVSRALTDFEIYTLTEEIGKAELVGTSSPTLNCRIWLVFDDGTVISPYLSLSAGNTSHALLFDYQAELAPTERFLSCISNLIG